MTYVVQSGDTMYLIAKKFGISLEALIAANPQIPDPNLIYPGQVLTIPATGRPSPPPHRPSPPPRPMHGWCTLVLSPVHPKIEPGCALVRFEKPHIMVATMSMPDPSSLTDCDVYTAWVTDGDDGRATCGFDLLSCGRGFWINHTSPSTLPSRGEVLVTAESMRHGSMPKGTKVLRGYLCQCCRDDS